jgi:hypothetical protein
MKGACRSRKGTHALRRRCPVCRKLRKFREGDSSQSGEGHPRRMPWVITPFGWCCGWCVERRTGLTIGLGECANRERVVRLMADDGGMCPRG